jgi:hypothetical protein
VSSRAYVLAQLLSSRSAPHPTCSHLLFSRVSPEHRQHECEARRQPWCYPKSCIRPTHTASIYSNATTHPQQPAQAILPSSGRPTPHLSGPSANTSSESSNDGLSSHAGARSGPFGRLRVCKTAESLSRPGQNRTKRGRLGRRMLIRAPAQAWSCGLRRPKILLVDTIRSTLVRRDSCDRG